MKVITDLRVEDYEEVLEDIEQYEGTVISFEDLKLNEDEYWLTEVREWKDEQQKDGEIIKVMSWSNEKGVNLEQLEQYWDDYFKNGMDKSKKLIVLMRCKTFNGLDYVRGLDDQEALDELKRVWEFGAWCPDHFDMESFSIFEDEHDGHSIERLDTDTGIGYYSIQNYYPIRYK